MVLLGSVGSKVLGPGGDEVSGLDGDDGTVGVGDKSGEASVDGDDAVVVGVGVAGSVGERSSSNRVDGTTSGGVGNLGSVHLRGVDGDDGSVGVADKSSEVGVAGSVAEGVNRVDSASSSSVSGLGSDHVSGVGGHHGAVGVGHQLGGGESHAGRENLQKMMSKKKLGYFAIFIREMFHDPFIKKEDYFDFSSHL